MSTDTVTPTDTLVHTETNSNTTADTAAAAETNIHQNEESSSNGVHANGTTIHTETSEPSEEDQKPLINDTYEDEKVPSINKHDLEPESLRKVFIGGLSYKTDEPTFRTYFAKYGDIVDSIIMRDRESRSRGFGFVTYAASTMVDALMAARPHFLDSREIEPKRAVPREESGKPESSISVKKLFVGGIREGSVNEQDLWDYFSKYGTIIDAVIMKTNEGKLRGFGFVEFDDYDPVDKIVLEKHHVIKENPVNVEKALPKDQTNRARMAQSNYGGSGGGMRGPPPRMGGGGGGGGGGWGPMGGESTYGGGGGGGYRSGPSGGGGYGSGADYGGRPGPYAGGYGGDMSGGGNPGGGMMGYGNSGPMGGGGYGMGGPGRSGYDDNFGAFGPPPSNYGFGQNYGTSSGGGPMRRGGGPGRGGGPPYARGGRGGAGGGSFRGRN